MKKNILIIGSSHPSSIEKMFYHSFKKLKLKVQFLDPNLNIKLYKKNKIYFKLFKNNYFKNYNEIIYDNLKKKYKSNIIFFFKGESLNKKFLEKLRLFKENIYINYFTDNPFYGKSKYLNIIKYFDFYFTWSKDIKKNIIKKKLYLKKYAINYLPFGYDFRYRKKINLLKLNNKKYLFYGSWDIQREKVIEKLQLDNIDIYGNGWHKAGKLFKNKNKIYYKDIFGQNLASKINKYNAVININRPKVNNAHNMRLFEVAGYGGLIITKETHETLNFFKKNCEIITYKNYKELKNILKNNIKLFNRNKIRKKCFNKSKFHSYITRCEKILKIIKYEQK